MPVFPVVNYISNAARTEGQVKTALEDTIAATKQIPGAGVLELFPTISGGSITPNGGGGVYIIDTEAASATDDLANIITTNHPDGSMILIRNANAARLVVVKSLAGGAGQMNLDRVADYTLDDTKKWLLLQRRGTDWFEIFRSPARATIPVLAKSATYTVAKEDIGKLISCTGTFTLSLLAVATSGNGFAFFVKNTGVGVITIDPNSAELINGVATMVLTPGRWALCICDGTAWTALNNAGPLLQTEQVTTSGTAINFTGIPSGVRRISIMFSGVSLSAGGSLTLQIGDSGGLETTGYSGSYFYVITGTSYSAGLFSFYYVLANIGSTASTFTGTIVLNLENAATNTWVIHGILGQGDTNSINFVGGVKSLSAELDRLQISTSAGTATFDAGAINISYE